MIADLIDTLWNVKQLSLLPRSFLLRDLIDTLWNVKKVDVRNWNEDHSKDLIDTLWNVKQ